MELFKSVVTTDLADLIILPSTQINLPELENYKLLNKTNGEANVDDLYLQLNVKGTNQWIEFVHQICINNEASQDGLVIILDCACQFGSKEVINSGLSVLRDKLLLSGKPKVDTDKILNNVFVSNKFNTLEEVNQILTNLLENVPMVYQNHKLSCVVVSNTSIFYWGLRDAGELHVLNDFHKICKDLTVKYGCHVITSKTVYE